MTFGLDHGRNESIRTWFQRFRDMPPLPLTADKMDFITGRVTFEDLMKRLLDSPSTNFILVVHGADDGSGLWLPLTHSRNKTEYWDLLKLMDVDSGKSSMSEKDGRRMGAMLDQHHVDMPHIKRILELSHKLSAKKIDTIEFRSCNLGRNTYSLDLFRQFLGARVAGAPDLHTVFGLPAVYIGKDFLEAHKRKHGNGNWETYRYPNELAGSRKDQDLRTNLVACFELNADQKPEAAGHVAATDADTLNGWVNDNISPGGKFAQHNLPIHGLWIADRQVSHPWKNGPKGVPAAIEVDPRDLKNPLGGWDGGALVRRFIPALSANYGKHIVYAK